MNKYELIAEYGYWGEHPDHDVETWKYITTNGDDRRGYWEWVVHRIEEEE